MIEELPVQSQTDDRYVPHDRLDESGWDGVVERWIPDDQIASTDRKLIVPVHHSCDFGSGNASWYGGKLIGHSMANGHPLDGTKLTAAHKTLPLGTHVRVINRKNQRSIVVEITDRGPFVGGRVIDLTRTAANAIGMGSVASVRLQCD